MALISFFIIKEISQGFLFSSFPIFFLLYLTIAFFNSIPNQSPNYHTQKSNKAINICIWIFTLVGIASFIVRNFEIAHFKNMTQSQIYTHNMKVNTIDRYPLIYYTLNHDFKNCLNQDPILKRNPFINLLHGINLYNKGNKDNSIHYMVTAISCNPTLIHSSNMSQLLKSDKSFATTLKKELIIRRPAHNRPKEIAKYGYLLKFYSLPEADDWLKKSVEQAPSLMTPWLLLGDSKKYNFLKFGRISDSSEKDHIVFNQFSLDDALKEEYRCRFQAWYGFNLE